MLQHSCSSHRLCLEVQVATLEAAVTFLQQLLPGRTMTRGAAYRDPEVLRTISIERTRSGMLTPAHASSNADKTGLCPTASLLSAF